MVQFSLEGISPLLTEAVLDKAFKLKTGSQDDLKSIEISRAAPAGSGLIGSVYRIEVTGTIYKASFVAKSMSKDPVLRESLDIPKFFKRETVFFSQILPALVEVQKALNAKEKLQKYIPICYAYHSDGDNDFLLMEDLRDRNCEAISDNPSKAERDSILKTLAHLHAVSMALRVKRPRQFAKFADIIPELYYREEDRERYTPFLQNAIKVDYEAVNEYEKPDSIYYKKFEDMVSNDLYGKLISMVKKKTKHEAIMHGDSWIANFLYTKKRTIIFDFQLTRCLSPAADLSFIIILSSCQGYDKEYALDGIKVYYEAIAYYLKDMGLDAEEVFSWEDLISELQEFGPMGMFMSVSTIPLIFSEKCDVLQNFQQKGLEKIPLDKLWPLKSYKNEHEKLTFINALRIAVDIGLI